MREGLAQLRMARTFRELSGLFTAPVVRLAEVALLWGRAYGHWEAGAVQEVGFPNQKELAAEAAANPYLGEQLDELRSGVDEAMGMVADGVLDATGEAHAADLLAQWEGFGRFCRDVLGVDPLADGAVGLGGDEPAAEVLEACSRRRRSPAACSCVRGSAGTHPVELMRCVSTRRLLASGRKA